MDGNASAATTSHKGLETSIRLLINDLSFLTNLRGLAQAKRNVTQRKLRQAVRNYLTDVNARTPRYSPRKGIPERIISFLKTPQIRLLYYDGRPEIGDIRQIIPESNFNSCRFGNQAFFSASEKGRFSWGFGIFSLADCFLELR